MLITRSFVTAGLCSMLALSANAQERPFLFSVSVPPTASGRGSVAVETSAGDHAFDSAGQEHLEQRVGIQARLAGRVTFLARAAFASDSGESRTSQQMEVLYGLMEDIDHHGSIAAGGGLRHEPDGTNVLVSRIVAGRRLALWRVDGNGVVEKPLSRNRDALDLITSVGLARAILPSLYAGVEAIGEDLEGFWEADEAEGGAKLLIGPSVRVAPPNKHWQLSAAGGPLIRATGNSNQGTAVRSLPIATTRNSYAVRLSFDYRF
jgi:hypothetical protein